MSIDMSLIILSQEERSLRFHLDNKSVLAQTISLRNPVLKQNCIFPEITPYSLYGILRCSQTRMVYLTTTDPVFIVIEFSDSFGTGFDYFRLPYNDYLLFSRGYCTVSFDSKNHQINWMKEGF